MGNLLDADFLSCTENFFKLKGIIILILVFGFGCSSHYSNSELADVFTIQGLKVKETERGVVVFLPEVIFEFGRGSINKNSTQRLDNIGDILASPKVESRKVLIEGHTDSVGSTTYNEKLSIKRANSVTEAFILRKVERSRITSNGYGEKYPIAPNKHPDGSDNPDGRVLNRRVEIILQNIN